MNIFLVGYMASGKTTVGLALAKKINYNFIDLDDYIEQKEFMSISEIFDKKGEIYFRKIENKYLNELLENNDRAIISLGGGTPCYANNMTLITNSENATTIYLKASLKELVSRLMKDKDKRPLVSHLQSEEAFFEFIGKHLFERSNYYNKSQQCVLVDNKTPESIVEEIILELY